MPPSTSLNDHIFVQIAAYRDLELVPTVRDAIAQAAQPDRIHFGICWQYADTELHLIDLLQDIPHCRITAIPAKQAQGLGWARNKAQDLWEEEAYTLQIDSHMRFAPRWDETLLTMLAQCPSEKPVLSSFPPAYLPPRDLVSHNSTCIRVTHFADQWDLRPQAYGDLSDCDAPQPGSFIAGGFSFSSAQVIQEVPQDPNIYFTDEIPYAVRLWTHGWDVYHPHQVVCWHFYNAGKSRIGNWDDHRSWWQRQRRTATYTKQLLGMEPSSRDFGCYGLGNQRSLAEFESRVNVNFKQRTINGVVADTENVTKESSVTECDRTRENELLILCSQPNHSDLQTTKLLDLAQNHLDWDYVLRVATEQGIIPLLFQNLIQDNKIDLYWQAKRDLTSEYRANVIHNLQCKQELLTILGLFQAHNIRALPYKGVTLAIAAYGDIVRRQFCDLDILVDPEQFMLAQKILTEHHYQALTPSSDHAWDFVLSNGKVTLDLHRYPVPKFYAFDLTFDTLWEQAQSITIQDQVIMMPSPEDMILMLSIHGLKDRWRRLIWLRDLAEISRSTPDLDWDYILKAAQNLGIQRTLSVGFKLAHITLEIELPEILKESISRDSQLDWCCNYLRNQLLVPLNRLPQGFVAIIDSFRLDLAVRERWQDRKRYLVLRILSPTNRDRTLLNLPNALNFLYLLIRPLRLLYRFTLSRVQRLNPVELKS
ncbi:nucleotidyltransferase family protein [Spirulina major CS-329]|uniref:GlcNAc-transferase family protein n=1 Tax=Spirulina TaxID=1154 RepID=UPI00232CE43D|nr:MULTISPECIES: GlcNAc-transferase family protein [Spirulina]MDB9493027.1 nucleotidyltransferase family protein [Spirulina subsalsa CS-330]MDB9504636.1 nucleotidyltransferase family protein [Spirulina major CS-329]